MATSIWEHFCIVPDPRVERTQLHSLEDVLVITICAVICGAETWVDIAEFGRAKEAWFRTFLALPNGIPSHDTFGRVFAALDARAFEEAFETWIADVAGSSADKLIVIDGKTIRRSLDRASGHAAIHVVSVWVHENHAVFGQLRTEDKSNEITAIPKLLEMLDLQEATVTIDAVGCQKEIARKVRDRGGHYVLAVKANQQTRYEDLRLFLDDAITRDFQGLEPDHYEQTEKGHGRLETRRCWTTSTIDWLGQRHEWSGLQSIAAVECHRQIGEQARTERRYFISSLPARTAQRVGRAVRNHWCVENELHWSLDVCFGKDQSRVRIGNAAEDLSRVRRLGGYGHRDLYLTVRLPDGTWSKPRNLGPKINTAYIEHGPRISPDKKHLFVSRSNDWDPKNYMGDIYWVELKEYLPESYG
jgi:predicted transposase YbfD/YdcC